MTTATTVRSRSAVAAFDVEVLRTTRLSPGFLRVTFGGPALHGFRDPGAAGPRDLRVKLVFPVGGRPPVPLGELTDGWYQRWRALPARRRGEMRTFTVRAARLGGPRPEVDVDFAVHTDGEPGPAARWAAAARRGDRLTMVGPGPGQADYGGIEWRPPHRRDAGRCRVLLVGDETAAPAVCSILEGLPSSYTGHALLEVAGAEDILDVRSDADVEICWWARGRRPRGQLLDGALRDLRPDPGPTAPVTTSVTRPVTGPVTTPATEPDPADELVWDRSAAHAAPGSLYAWVAGEAALVRAVRRYLRDEVGLDRRQLACMGYWRAGRPEG